MKKIPLIILTGPTAVGKTSLSIDVAKKFNCEIISSDSMQIYKYMDIGSAKVTEEEKDGIKHHLIDFVDPDENYSVSDFKEDASRAIEEISHKNKLPLITGGTGLYLNSLIYDMDFAKADKDDEIRVKYMELADELGHKKLHDLLMERDPQAAERIHPNNVKRVIRALEVVDTGGINRDFTKDLRLNDKYDPIIIVLDRDRDELNERIYKRVDMMFEQGLIDEVRSLLNKGYDRNLTSMQGIGYKEIIDYIDGLYSIDEVIEKIKISTRQYAKRQRTWFRRYKDKLYINFSELSYTEAKDKIYDYIENRLGGSSC